MRAARRGMLGQLNVAGHRAGTGASSVLDRVRRFVLDVNRRWTLTRREPSLSVPCSLGSVSGSPPARAVPYRDQARAGASSSTDRRHPLHRSPITKATARATQSGWSDLLSAEIGAGNHHRRRPQNSAQVSKSQRRLSYLRSTRPTSPFRVSARPVQCVCTVPLLV